MRSRRKVQNRMSVLKRTGKKNVLALALAIAMVSSTLAGEPLSIHAYADETNAISSSDDGSSKSDASSEKSTSVKEEKSSSKEEKSEAKTEKSSEEKSGTSIAAKSAIQIVTEAENSASSDTKSSDVKLGTSDNDTKATEKDNASGQKSSGSTGNTSANTVSEKSTEATGAGTSQSSESSKENTTETKITTTDAAKSDTASSDATTAANTSTGASTSTDVNGSASKGTGASTSTGSSTGAASTGAGAVPETTAPETNAPETSQAETTAAVETTEAETTAPETTAELDEEAEKKAESARIRKGILAADTAARKAKLGKTGSWKSSIFDFVKHLFYINVVADAENEADDVEDESISEMEVSEDDIDDYSVDLGKDYTANVVDDEDHVSGKNCFTSIIMARKVSGKWKAQSEFHDGDSVRVSLAVSIPSDAMDEDSRVFYYQLPSAVTISEEQSGLMKRDDIVIGKYMLTEDGMLVVKLTDNISVNQKFRGIIVFDAELAKADDQTMEKIDFGSYVFILHDGASNDSTDGDAEDVDDETDETEPTDTVEDDANKKATSSEIAEDGELNTRSGLLKVSNRIVTATANYPAGTFPIGTKMQVVRVKKPSELKTLKTKVDAQLESENSGKIAKDIYAYDISFIYDGEKIEPLNPVDISLQFNKSQGKPKATKAEDPEKAEWKMFHATEDGEIAEKTDATENESEETQEDETIESVESTESTESIESANQNNASATDASTEEATTSDDSESAETTTGNSTTDLVTENSVLHDITEDAEVSTDSDNKVVHKVDFSSDSFSVYVLAYTVDFHYGDYTWSIDGEASVRLSEVLKQLGLDINISDIQDVSLTLAKQVDESVDEKELYLEKQENDWLIKSDIAFNNIYTMTIKATDGMVYEIEITDANKKGDDLSKNNQITSVVISKKDSNGNWVSTDTINEGDTTQFSINFKIPANKMDSSKSAYYQLPGNITLSNGSDGTLYDKNDATKAIGTYSIDSTGLISMTFNENIDVKKETIGNVTFQGKASCESAKDNYNIKFPGSGTTIKVVVPDEKKYDIATVKEGTLADDLRSATYTVTVSTEKGTGEFPVTIGDYVNHWNMTNITNASYDESTLRVIKIAANGNESSVSGYTVTWNNSWDDDANKKQPNFTITGLGKLAAGEKYRVSYKLNFTQKTDCDGYGLIGNTGWSKYGDHNPSEALCRKEWTKLVAKGGEYEENNRRIKWTVWFNDRQTNIAGMTFTDAIPGGVLADGKTSASLKRDPDDGTNIELNVNGGTLSYTFPNGTEDKHKYKLEYYTPVTDSTTGNVSNTAHFGGFEAKADVSVAHRTSNTEKKFQNESDLGNGTLKLTWRIEDTIGSDVSSMTSYTITDEIGKGDDRHYGIASEIDKHLKSGDNIWVSDAYGLHNYGNINDAYIKIDLKYYDKNGNEVSANDSSTHVKKFELLFTSTNHESFSLNYVYINLIPTIFNILGVEPGTTLTATNNANNASASHSYTVPNELSKQVKISDGSFEIGNQTLQYNSSDKTITYRLLLTTHSDVDENGQEKKQTLNVTDILPKGLTYIEDSLNVKFHVGDEKHDYYEPTTNDVWGDKNVDFLDKAKPSLDISINDEGRTVLAITIPNYYWCQSRNKIVVYYKLSYANDSFWNDLTHKDKEYLNSATYNGSTSSVNVDIHHDESYLDKSAEQLKDDTGNNYRNLVNYSIIINSSGLDLIPDSDELVLTDKMVNQYNYNAISELEPSLDLSTVHLYEYHAEQDEPVGKEIDKNRYSLTYDASTYTLTVKIPDSLACVLKYQYKVNKSIDGNGQVLTNYAELAGKYSTDTKTTLHEVTSSGQAYQKSIKFIKVDEDNYNVTLPGTVFNMYFFYTKKGKWSRAYEYTTDETGALNFVTSSENPSDFKVRNDYLYKLEEKTPLAGYEAATGKVVKYFIWLGENSNADTVYKNFANYNNIPSKDEIEFIKFTGTTEYITNKYQGIRVVKVWLDHDGNGLEDQFKKTVEVKLYKKTSNGSKEIAKDRNGKEVEAKYLTAENEWTAEWTNLPTENGEKYYVIETEDTGFDVSYSSNNESGIDSGVITVTNKKKSYYVLPETGSRGTTIIYLLGSIILLLAAEFYLIKYREVSRK